MALTPGSRDKLNILSGITSTVFISEANKTAYANRVFREGMVFHDAAGKLYHADGVKTLAQLLAAPIVDPSVNVLTAAERQMIADANKAGGFVATDDINKISDDQLSIVQDGKIVESYLSDYIENGIIKLDVLPAEIRKHMKYVSNYAGLEALTEEERKSPVFVIDASDDPTVETGWAIYVWADLDYVWVDLAGTGTNAWVKIQEGEGIDYDVNAVTTHDTVENVGTVMYDHIVELSTVSLDQLSGKEMDPDPDEGEDTPTEATLSTRDLSFADGEIITGIGTMTGTGTHKLTVSLTETGTVEGRSALNEPPAIVGKFKVNFNNTALKVTASSTPVSASYTGDVDSINAMLQLATIVVTNSAITPASAQLKLVLDDDESTAVVSNISPGLRTTDGIVVKDGACTDVDAGGLHWTIGIDANYFGITSVKAKLNNAGDTSQVYNYTIAASDPTTAPLAWGDGGNTGACITVSGTQAEINAKLFDIGFIPTISGNAEECTVIGTEDNGLADPFVITIKKRYTQVDIQTLTNSIDVTTDASFKNSDCFVVQVNGDEPPTATYEIHAVADGVKLSRNANDVANAVPEVTIADVTANNLETELGNIYVYDDDTPGGTIHVTVKDSYFHITQHFDITCIGA